MVSISGPRDLPASASQSAGITGVSHRARPSLKILNHISPYKWVHSKKATMSKPRREPSRGNQKAGWYLDLGLSSLQNAEVDPGKRIFRERTLFSFPEHRVGQDSICEHSTVPSMDIWFVATLELFVSNC
ncbi:uncharacterized protein LOC144336138 [Macaca mulatta]